MQIVKDDDEIKPYVISIMDLADLLGISASNIYRDIEDITDDIIKNPVYVREEKSGKTTRFIKIPWVTKCEYKSDVGVALKLNEELKPFLICLKDHYTQYTLQEILSMKSIYAIRIFELIQSKIMHPTLPRTGVCIQISVQEIRECCDCEDKYPSFGNFKERVLDTAVNEINKVSMYNISYSYIKQSRSVVAINFNLSNRLYL